MGVLPHVSVPGRELRVQAPHKIAPLRLAVLGDYLEENWRSMNLCAEMLTGCLEKETVAAKRLWPPFHHRATRLPWLGRGHLARNIDRSLNRLWDYPPLLKAHCKGFDCFHVVDHSYSQLVHQLPAERTGVFCHDLDTFRCLLQPDKERRPRWFRAMTAHILRLSKGRRGLSHNE